ncbi:hypothetical protein BDV93DRAFT_587227 [Ceratobasidium sp. AG-I]|nr:hypothetical protein BDV93DRAFT_587227 [Ceratobasidium sp. AG-I]
MASNTPGGQSQKSRHRITNIKLEPSTSNYDVALKILIDGQVARRLTFIRHGSLLSWSRALACDVDPSSRVEIRVYEKHALRDKRVGSLEYVVSTVTDKSETSLEFDTKKYTAVLSLPTPEEASYLAQSQAEHAPVTALTEAQSSKRNRRLLDRLGPTRDALKTILEFGGVVAELHPAAKMAFGMCKAVWEMLEKQEQCDANVEKLIVGLAARQEDRGVA